MTIAAALEISVLFVCVWGFIAILLTGQFGIPIVLACIAALIIGYYLRRNGWKPSPLAANVSAIFVFLMAIGIFSATLNLLSATVHLFLFLQVTKYITRRTLDEIRWCYLISLFNIVGASVITTTFTFGPVLVVYIFLVLVSLRLYVIAREFERNGIVASRAARARSTSSENDTRRSILPGFVTGLWASRPHETSHSTRLSLSQMRLPRGLVTSGILLTIITMGLSGMLFSIIPRLATQNLFQSYGQSTEDSSVSAFSENVEFGSFTEIQLDESIALFVQPVGSDRPRYVRMRGVALDRFDGQAWRRSTGGYMQSGTYEYQPAFTTRIYPNSYTYRVLQPAGITTFLFGDSFPTSMRVPQPFQYSVDPLSQAIQLSEPPPKEFHYEVETMQEDLVDRQDPTKLTQSRPSMHLVPILRGRRALDDDVTSAAAVMQFFGSLEGQLLDTFGEVHDGESDELNRRRPRRYRRGLEPMESAELAETTDAIEQTEPQRTRPDGRRMRRRADADGQTGHYPFRRQRLRTGKELLDDYLARCLELPDGLNTGRVPELAATWTSDAETTFAKAMVIESRLRTRYGYSLTPRASGNFIESFLFDVREGHCEFFATSMAVLLRNIGIPARVVNGFYSTEWNALSNHFTVRQKDAHSWVEAWMGDDYGWMTFDPTPPSGVARRNNRGAIMEGLSRMSDALRMRWYRYVIDYSFSDQVQIVRYMARVRDNIVSAMKSITIAGIIGDDAKTIEQGGFSNRIDWRPIGIALGIIISLLGWQALRWIMRRRRPQFSMVRFYDDLLKALAQRGITILPGETPREFAVRVAGMRPDWSAFAGATDIYYNAKYNQVTSDKSAGGGSTGTRKKSSARHYGLTDSQIDELAELKKAIRQKSRRTRNQPQ